MYTEICWKICDILFVWTLPNFDSFLYCFNFRNQEITLTEKINLIKKEMKNSFLHSWLNKDFKGTDQNLILNYQGCIFTELQNENGTLKGNFFFILFTNFYPNNHLFSLKNHFFSQFSENPLKLFWTLRPKHLYLWKKNYFLKGGKGCFRKISTPDNYLNPLRSIFLILSWGTISVIYKH